MRPSALFVLLALAPGAMGAQVVVPIHEEPRHRPVYEGSELTVLDIEIPPGDTTLFHRHDAPIAYVFISPMPTNAQVLGQSWGSPDQGTGALPGTGSIIFDETYPEAPTEHRVTNLGQAPFRLIAVLNRGAGQAPGGEEPRGAAAPYEAEGRWFRSTHHLVASQGMWAWEGHSRPVVMVQVSSGALTVQAGSGPAVDLQGPGDFVVLPPGVRAYLRNGGVEAVNLGIIEVR